jgi:hypothetical protein
MSHTLEFFYIEILGIQGVAGIGLAAKNFISNIRLPYVLVNWSNQR